MHGAIPAPPNMSSWRGAYLSTETNLWTEIYVSSTWSSHSLTHSLTHSMDQSSSWEANSHLPSQEITRLLCNPKVHYSVHNSLALVPILVQMNPVHIFPHCFP